MMEFEKDILFEHISGLVLQGYIAGSDPDWQLTFLDISHSEISEGTVKQISQQIKDWVKSGEVQEDYKQGWWYLKTEHSSVQDNSPDWQFMEDYIKSLPYSNNI